MTQDRSDVDPIDMLNADSSMDLVLLSNFVHQIVNPLNGIAGTLDNIATNVIKNDGRRDQRLRAARSQLEQCISLMRNLAYFAQGFQRITDSERREILVPEQIIRSAMFFQEDAELKGVRISLKENRVPNRVPGHLELLNQVYINIFDNCVKYSSNSSEVEVHQWIQKGSDDLLVTVKNSMKIPLNKAEVGRIFDLGYRGVNARQVIASGTGIGMYICKKIVEEVHGGKLSCELVGNNDIVFTIRLPGAYCKPYVEGELQ